MKVQEVILKAMAKLITWWQAAEILGISVRSMRRWRARYEQTVLNDFQRHASFTGAVSTVKPIFRDRPAMLPSGNTYFHRANTCFRDGFN